MRIGFFNYNKTAAKKSTAVRKSVKAADTNINIAITIFLSIRFLQFFIRQQRELATRIFMSNYQ